MRFSKMHGAGNDFVVLDLRDGTPAPGATLCRALADRRTGVGCDQILTIQPPRSAGAVAAYGIHNADGSAAGQCGNGGRCVAAWLRRDAADRGSPLPERFAIDSPAGVHAVDITEGERVRLEMGRPDFDPARIPLHGLRQAQEYALTIDGVPVRFGAVSMGNPHAVLRVDDVARADVAVLGARLQRDPAFPQSVNVGFAERVDDGRIRLRVFERGVGETLACGSGACAAAAVFMRQGWVGRSVAVQLPGGELCIDWPDDDAPLSMAGPAAFVFEGEWLQ